LKWRGKRRSWEWRGGWKSSVGRRRLALAAASGKSGRQVDAKKGVGEPKRYRVKAESTSSFSGAWDWE
jgi:hypothetical protein